MVTKPQTHLSFKDSSLLFNRAVLLRTPALGQALCWMLSSPVALGLTALQNGIVIITTAFLGELSQVPLLPAHSAFWQQCGGKHLKFFGAGVEMTLLTRLGYIYFQPCQLALCHLILNNEPHSS